MKETTIAAISTASGEAGIGVVRLSGPESLAIAKRVFQMELPNRRMVFGKITDPEGGLVFDEALCVYMEGPHSYTGEDVVEFQCHGSAVVIKNILELLLRQGAVLAERGEFTKRAFLNGRMDLSQAEAVIDLIKARSSSQSEAALSQMEGSVSRAVRAIRKDLMELLVQLTVNMDYPDEDIEQLTYEEIENSLSAINDTLCKLKESAGEGKIIREGLSVAIVGKPNVGKSSLMNAFLKENRSIVTDVPGTTRDTIEEQAVVRGITIRFIDTAGIHESVDKVESIGIERSKEALSGADLLLLVLDGSSKLSEEDIEILKASEGIPRIYILNKADLGSEISPEDFRDKISCDPALFDIISVSAKENDGIEKIADAMEKFITGGKIRKESDVLVTNVRHINLIANSLKEISEAIAMTKRNEAMDFIEINVRAAFDFLGEIIGETASDQVIDEVFSRFCLGK